jgi:transcription antitermination factor NusB
MSGTNPATARSPGRAAEHRAVRKRTRARELALQALYLVDVRGRGVEDDADAFLEARAKHPDVLAFAQQLVHGCLDRQAELDEQVGRVAENWQIHRMAVIDRNILRLGTYELLHLLDVPPKVSINEAIDLAKKYSTGESGAFVNGILDKLRTELRPEEPRP